MRLLTKTSESWRLFLKATQQVKLGVPDPTQYFHGRRLPSVEVAIPFPGLLSEFQFQIPVKSVAGN
jgi:hypothetical protein